MWRAHDAHYVRDAHIMRGGGLLCEREGAYPRDAAALCYSGATSRNFTSNVTIPHNFSLGSLLTLLFLLYPKSDTKTSEKPYDNN